MRAPALGVERLLSLAGLESLGIAAGPVHAHEIRPFAALAIDLGRWRELRGHLGAHTERLDALGPLL